MKIFKKVAIIIAAVALSLLFVLSASAAETGISELSVSFEADGADISVNWWQGKELYYIFLPADAHTDNLTLGFTASGTVSLDGETVDNGSVVSLEAGKTYTFSCDTAEYKVYVLKSENVPSLHITTQSGSMDAVHADKSHKEPAGITIIADGEALMEGEELEYIKGRGNATWSFKKKPYNIKFEAKTDLFGMGKAKKWSLLANYLDKSLIHNTIAFDIANALGLKYTSKHNTVDLFINGDYYGNYLLCESVEVGKTRVDINDLEGDTEDVNTKDLDEYSLGGAQESDYKELKAGTQKWVKIPNNPENITGGYLLEYELPDRYVDEVSGFVTNRNQTIVVKAPEYASEAQVKYISALYQEFEDAVFSETGYNSKGKHYTEYIDVESFAAMYVFQEYIKNLDAGLTSFYLCKDKDSDVFVAAPVWDFDNSLGRNYDRYGTNAGNAKGWWAGVIYNFTSNDIKYLPTILSALYKHDDFFALASDEWNNKLSPMLTDEYFNSIDAFTDSITASAVMNSIRWEILGKTDYSSTATEYKKHITGNLLKFMKERKAFLDEGFAENTARVFFDANGGKGNTFNEDALKVGDKYTLPEDNFTNLPYSFAGWSTTPDGSSGIYEAGDTVTLDSTRVTFYAQWNEISVLSGFQKFIQGIKDFFRMIRDFFANIFG